MLCMDFPDRYYLQLTDNVLHLAKMNAAALSNRSYGFCFGTTLKTSTQQYVTGNENCYNCSTT